MPKTERAETTRLGAGRLAGAVLVALALLTFGSSPASADGRRSHGRDDDWQRGRVVVIVPAAPARHRHHAQPRRAAPVRQLGYRQGYRHGHHDRLVNSWLGFAALSLPRLYILDDGRGQDFERAHWQATTAPIGQSVVWREQAVSGSVVATREGSDTAGRYCREFQQTVTVGGRTESGYGTACRQPDGAWQIVSTGE